MYGDDLNFYSHILQMEHHFAHDLNMNQEVTAAIKILMSFKKEKKKRTEITPHM